MAGAAEPVVARHSKLRFPLLFVPAFFVRLPDWCPGQLRRAGARGARSALPAAWDTAARGRGERVARLRLGLPVRVPAGFAGQDPHPQGGGAGLGRLHPLRRAGGAGHPAAADTWVQRHSLRRPNHLHLPAVSRGCAGSRPASLDPERDGGQRLADELVQIADPGGLLCLRALRQPSLVPHLLSIGRLAGAV